MVSGFICLHRDALDHPLLQDAGRLGAFLWLVARAAWKPVPFDINGKVIIIERGQLCTSRSLLAKAWGWSPSAVERFLTRLKTEQMIEQATGQGKSIITICNYEKYQSISSEAGQTTGQATGQASDSDRTAKEQGNKGTSNIPSLRSGIVDGTDDSKEDEKEPVFELIPKIPKPDAPQYVDEAIECWNLAAAKYGWPTIKAPINPSRREKLKLRLREKKIDGWKDALRKAWGGYLGRDPPSFFTFDWIIKNSNNIDKVLDGNYERNYISSEGGNAPPTQPSNALLRASQRFNERYAGRADERSELRTITDASARNS